MSENTALYHGSNVKVEKPEVLVRGYYKDFGYGFYCTNIKKQAHKWALAKSGVSIITVFRYRPQEGLRHLLFSEMTEEWLDFVVACRRGIKHDYDIVEGPMADDQIWDYVESLMEGSITREAFWVLAKFKHPTHQIVFCTEKALSTLTYERSYAL